MYLGQEHHNLYTNNVLNIPHLKIHGALVWYQSTTFNSGLLKWRPAGQIWPAALLRVARGQALIKEKYRPNDTCHIFLSIIPLFLSNLTPRFTPVSATYTKWPHFLQSFNIKLKNMYWQFYGKMNQILGTVNVSDRKFWAVLHEITQF